MLLREIGNPARRGTAHRGEQWVADKPTELKTLNIAVKRRLAVATFLSEHSDGFGESLIKEVQWLRVYQRATFRGVGQ